MGNQTSSSSLQRHSQDVSEENALSHSQQPQDPADAQDPKKKSIAKHRLLENNNNLPNNNNNNNNKISRAKRSKSVTTSPSSSSQSNASISGGDRLQSLLKDIRSMSPQNRLSGAQALSRGTRSSRSNTILLFRSPGAFESIVNLFWDDDANTRSHASRVVANMMLMSNNETCDALGKTSGIVDRLGVLVGGKGQQGGELMVTRRNAASILGNLAAANPKLFGSRIDREMADVVSVVVALTTMNNSNNSNSNEEDEDHDVVHGSTRSIAAACLGKLFCVLNKTLLESCLNNNSNNLVTLVMKTATSDANPTVRSNLVWALGNAVGRSKEIGKMFANEDDCVNTMASLLTDENNVVRRNAAEAVGSFGSIPEFGNKIKDSRIALDGLCALLGDSDVGCRRDAAWAVSMICDEDSCGIGESLLKLTPEILLLLVGLLDDEDIATRANATSALGNIADSTVLGAKMILELPSAVKLLSRLLMDGATEVRGNAAWTLGSILASSSSSSCFDVVNVISSSRAEMQQVAVNLLSDSDGNVRHGALWLLSYLPAEYQLEIFLSSSQQILGQMTSASDAAVRRMAAATVFKVCLKYPDQLLGQVQEGVCQCLVDGLGDSQIKIRCLCVSSVLGLIGDTSSTTGTSSKEENARILEGKGITCRLLCLLGEEEMVKESKVCEVLHALSMLSVESARKIERFGQVSRELESKCSRGFLKQ